MKTAGPLLGFFAHRLCGFSTQPCYHSHTDYEVYYFHEGDGAVLIGEKVIDLVPGDLIIFNGIKRHGSLMRGVCSRTSLRIEEASALPLLQLPGSVDLFRPFRELRHYHWRLTGSRKEEAEQLLAKIARFYNLPGQVHFTRLRMAVAELLLFIYDCYECGKPEGAGGNEAAEDKETLARSVMAYVEQHYARELSLEELAQSVHFSKYYVLRQFKEATGMTVFDYIRRRRINQAKLLFMLNRAATVSDIGYRVGFKQPTHFSRNFKLLVGMSPERYRKQAEAMVTDRNDR